MFARCYKNLSNLDQAKEELSKNRPKDEFAWTEEAMKWLNRVPFFLRNMAKKSILDFARERKVTLIDGKLMDEVRQKVGM